MTDQPKTGFKKLTEGKVLKVAFVVSLAFNVLVISVLAGGMLHGRRPAPMGGFDMNLGEFGAALSREDRGKIREDLHANPNFRPIPRGAREASVQRFLVAIRAEPFDPVAVEKIFETQRNRGVEAMEAGQRALLQRLTEMNAEERQAFADRLEGRSNSGKKEN